VEGNGLIGGRPLLTLTLAKASFTAALVLTMHELATHGHPRAARLVGYLDGGLTFGVAVHNTRVAR
jgi:hypothetical protein